VYPYTDTFYGTVREWYNWEITPDTIFTLTYIYAVHPASDSIKFISNYFDSHLLSFYSPVYIGYYGFNFSYPVNDSNYYSYSTKQPFNNSNVKITGDSLIYNNVTGQCLNNYFAHFDAIKI